MTIKTHKPFFRADHVGSLLRPAALKEARMAFDDEKLPREQLTRLEDEAIDAAILMQESVGLKAVTDGEFRRARYFGHFTDKVTGFTMMESVISFDEDEKQIRYMSPAITGRLSHIRPIAADELTYVKPRTALIPKITLPSPTDQHMFRYREGISNLVYPDLDEFFHDVAVVYQKEIAALAAAGGRYVQLDDTTFTLFCDEKWRQRIVDRGYDPTTLVDRYVNLVNECIKNAPAEMTIALHMCRGNNQGEWLFSGGYDTVAEAVFSNLNIDSFFLEYDSERAGTFEPLKTIPHDKFVVLGLVTSKGPALEQQAALVERIESAAAYFPLDRMGISPQCGFASTLPGNPLAAADQKRKLALVVETAKQVWGSITV